MSETLLISFAAVLVLGIGAQWLAWRFKLPSILLLLVFGFLAGPVSGVLDPQLLRGDWVFPLVSLSVGVILFEGGLSLRLSELREVGRAVSNLITIGVLVTWCFSALAAYYLAGFSVPMAIIIGSILVVTGPTVIVPLMRHVRPIGRVGAIAKWEGITIDPVGAILAVLVLEFVLLINEPMGDHAGNTLSEAVLHVVEGLFLEIVIGVGVAVLGAGILILLMRRRLLPDYLENPMVLMVVGGMYALADILQHESGLLATTLMGILMANQRFVSVRRIIAFKEDLRVMLIGGLFIVLSARLELSALTYFLDPGNLLFLAALMLVVRPLAVFFSSFGTNLTWKEQVFMGWLAPRGIVAAAVASLFGLRLESQGLYPAEADALVPTIFLVIVGTVAVYGLTISPLARWMGLAQPHPEGLLFVGAHPWARRIAEVLQEQGFQVLLIDANANNVDAARDRGLPAQHADALSETVIDDLDLTGIGRMLTVTPNDEVNSLAGLHFVELFESTEVYQLASRSEAQRGDLPSHLRGRALFGKDITFKALSDRFEHGADVEVFELGDEKAYEALIEQYGDEMVPLFFVRPSGHLHIVSGDAASLQPAAGETLIALIGPAEEESGHDQRRAAVATAS